MCSDDDDNDDGDGDGGDTLPPHSPTSADEVDFGSVCFKRGSRIAFTHPRCVPTGGPLDLAQSDES